MKIYFFLLPILFFITSCQGQKNKKLQCPAQNIVIYTKPICNYCIQLKSALKEHHTDYLEHDLTHNSLLHEKLKIETDSVTVPYVFIDGKYIGGYTDFEKLCLQSEK